MGFKMIKCIIVDDEPLALSLLEDYVSRTSFLQMEGKFSSGIEALSFIKNNNIDLVFIDIQMPQLNGLEFSRLVKNCAIIFTTAFEKYAIEGYKVNAIDYLLKPFSYAEFFTAANKAYKWFELQSLANCDAAVTQKSIVVKSEYRQQVINTNTITFIEGSKDYLKIHLDGGEFIQTLMSMKSIEGILSNDTFVRVHRSFIVNMDKVKTIERNRIVFGKEYIPISDSYREEFNRVFSLRTLN